MKISTALVLLPLLAAAACSSSSSSSSSSSAGGASGADGGGGASAIDTTGASSADGGDAGSTPEVVPPAAPDAPVVQRGAKYRGFDEKFNRYYTDAAYRPSKTVYVSPTGGGDGATKATPTTPAAALAAVGPGTEIYFVAGTYNGCFEVDADHGGTYDAPVVLVGERQNGARKAVVNCCATGRKTCFNLEGASYVAVDGFELVGGDYGVRSVGSGYDAPSHTKGNAALHCDGHDQYKDPFFTGTSDWFVVEGNVGHGAKSGDGHGIYLSNGSDWNLVRGNELYGNVSADFQINADPASSCTEDGIDVTSSECDAVAGSTTTGGRGASDFMLVENNFFHDGLAQGANFTSARNSIVRNNIFAGYAKHGVSFWQETENPKLGASDNLVLHNLFLARVANRQMLQFVVNSDRNRVENNVFVGVGAGMLALEVDDTVGANVYLHNFYINAALSGRSPNAEEHVRATLDTSWWKAFPTGASTSASDWEPTANAGFLDLGERNANAVTDRTGKARTAPTDLGPFER